ncbi:hypothetical protein FBT53_05270 [Flavobacterium sp. ASW18X]|nr:hypothetical protein FBT53_05270 [Flavobacterium sp. ASW18X]
MLLTFALRPAYYVGYFSYFQLNVDYIIENYCINKERPELACNGKCYLMQQLAAADDQKRQDSATNAALTLMEAFVPLFVQQTTDFSFQFHKEHTQQQLFSLDASWSYVRVNRMLRPPSC